ncbi:kinesin-like protein KIF23 [Belonocnema kinseyi]|uniref:kinesin-like protein KIF23 n=1 Tax=Belonocnema kinseyi TaxID=2817044 RepID=UPI00143CEE8D|nr:kinesin-like protein KIF23 [Belonocnema kinseyi]
MKSARSKPLTSARKPLSRTRFNNNNNMQSKDPVQVFCRLRPMQFPTESSCMRVISDTTIAITPPESATNFRTATSKEIQTVFTRVFQSDISQREVFNTVALPLVANLIQGKNGLLFTYGITGSGKTFTMTGDQQESGIMPRCVDVVFNSISNYQAKKFVFKPDRLNGFDVQSETDAMLDRQKGLNSGLMTPRNVRIRTRKVDSDSDSNPTFLRSADESQVIQVDPDNVYSVFVTYVEIYNNSVYDLLDEEDIRAKTLQSKIVREDGSKNMYVHSVTEVEVKTTEEAFEVFQRGQRKRRVAHTALNAESSRSHSVFTIRLVQAPLDCDGEHVIQDKRVVCISQLSLVDLAGSERTNRTKNTGQRLREAGNINNSLMTLRSCMEILRENQTNGTSKIVPYRDSKVTHMFKNYFDGEGQVRMIVCVNPRTDDYDETIHVMKFSEMTQEVQVARAAGTKLDLGFTPGRRFANKIFREARSRLEKERPEAADLEIDLGLVYSLGGPFPEMEVADPHNDEIITNLIHFLEQRINKRNALSVDLYGKQTDFRKMFLKMEEENTNLKVENASLKAYHSQQARKVSALQGHVDKAEAQIDSLLDKLNNANDRIRGLQQELQDKDMALKQGMIDKQRVKQKYNNKIQAETEKMNRELEMRMRSEHEHLQNQIKETEDKIRTAKKILTEESGFGSVSSEQGGSVPVISKEAGDSKTGKVHERIDHRSRRDRIPVANSRYRRSQSADRWVDHRPGAIVPVETILQPLMRRRRSVTRLQSPREITNGASRYCLVAQQQDSEGALETKLYKGDIVPTSGGGAQVLFNDVERLKQMSPTNSRKRSGTWFAQSNSEQCYTTIFDSKKPRV